MKRFISFIFIFILIIMVCLKIGTLWKSQDIRNIRIAVVDIDDLIKKDTRFSKIKDLFSQQEEIVKIANVEISLKTPPPLGIFEKVLRDRISLLAQSYKMELGAIEKNINLEEKRLIEEWTKKIEEELKKKEEELREKLNLALKEKEEKITSELANYKKTLSEKYSLRYFNLKMKLETLSLSKEEKEDLQIKIKYLEQQEKEEMAKKREELLQELKEFQKKEEENIIKELLALKEKREKEAQTEIKKIISSKFEQGKITAGELKNILQEEKTLQDKILREGKRMAYPDDAGGRKTIIYSIQKINKQRQNIAQRIKEDIISIISHLAKERDYDIIISKYFVNISAPDLTAEIEEVIKRK